jgi:hypothetical protein
MNREEAIGHLRRVTEMHAERLEEVGMPNTAQGNRKATEEAIAVLTAPNMDATACSRCADAPTKRMRAER